MIAPGESHDYPVTLRAGDWLRADVTQDGVDVALTLIDPAGGDLFTVDASDNAAFPETTAAIADQPGTYTIRVKPVTSARAPGRYSIRIEPARAATDADRHVVDAERDYAEGERLLDAAHADDWPEALARFRAAVTEYRHVDDRRGELKAMFGIAHVQFRLHDRENLQSARDTERMARELGDRAATALVLQLIGDIQIYQGDLTASIMSFQEAIGMMQELGDRKAELHALSDAAHAYDLLGDAEESISMLEQALAMARQAHDAAYEWRILNNLGVSYRQLGDYDHAIESYEWALANRHAAGDPRGQTLAYNNLGNVKSAAGSPLQAAKFHTRALALARQIGSKEDEARALSSLGNTELLRGEASKALEHERAALALREALGDVSGQADADENIGRALRRLGRLDEAAAAIEQALTIRRRINEQYNDADSLFDLARLESDRGQYAQAIEDATAATTLDEALRRIDNPDLRVAFRARGGDAYELLIDLLQQHGRPGTAAFDVSERARARVLLESVAESRIDRSRYSALPQPEPLTGAEIQQRVLDSGTVLLEFAIGKDHSWLWAVTPSDVVTVELPPRRVVDAAARRAYEELSTQSTHAAVAAAALSRMLLGGIATRLRTEWRGKRLAIVPSGPLGYVPFAALPVPGSHIPVALSAAHEIVMVPSASVIAALREEAARRPRARGAIAIVADPVFDVTDPRVAEAPRAPTTAPHGAPALSRLSFSRAEADAIASFASGVPVLKETGFEATRDSILGGALDDYRIVHLATHGVIDSDRPARSALILSLVGRTGAPLDGYLRQRDIYNLSLDADLVVLSACQTAVGKQVSGEGLMGLTRAFMYAGTPRVVATLWEVGDRATADFMKVFYRDLLQQHLRPAAALRDAQVEMARNPRYASPYYWAGFVLHGDWR